MSASSALPSPWLGLPVDLGELRHQEPPLAAAGLLPATAETSRHAAQRDALLLTGVSLALHGALAYLLIHGATEEGEPVVPPQTPPMVVELSRPPSDAPPTVEPPQRRPTPPLAAPVTPRSVAPAQTPRPIAEAATTLTPTPAPAPQPATATSAPSAPAAPSPAPVEETITEPSASAAYLRNPAPEYPPYAQRQGWEGKVLLRVHVLASGRPDSVEVHKSSGRRLLDEAALTAVKGWTFAPARKGKIPIDGWASVPIEFSLSQ